MSAPEWRCNRCGGELPDEGSEAWVASDGECPGTVTDSGCGAFDARLDWVGALRPERRG